MSAYAQRCHCQGPCSPLRKCRPNCPCRDCYGRVQIYDAASRPSFVRHRVYLEAMHQDAVGVIVVVHPQPQRQYGIKGVCLINGIPYFGGLVDTAWRDGTQFATRTVSRAVFGFQRRINVGGIVPVMLTRLMGMYTDDVPSSDRVVHIVLSCRGCVCYLGLCPLCFSENESESVSQPLTLCMSLFCKVACIPVRVGSVRSAPTTTCASLRVCSSRWLAAIRGSRSGRPSTVIPW